MACACRENSTSKFAVKLDVKFYSGFGYTEGKKGADDMPNIKPISDLRKDYEKTQATLRLMKELAKGRKSGDEKGWLTLEAVEEHLGIE